MIFKILYLIVIFVICSLICWHKKENTNSILYTLSAGIIVAIVGLLILPPDGPIYSFVHSLSHSTTQNPDNTTTNSSTETMIKQTNPPKKTIFQPDYSPGKENIGYDTTYKNNMGKFSVQDKTYYFATASGIYKMDSNFKNCKLISNDKYGSYLNVLGDWIYYATENGIYKIMTDGSNKSQIVKLDSYIYDMAVHYESVFYIKSDNKLYSNSIDGNNERCIYEKKVGKFLCTNLFLFVIEMDKQNSAIALKRIERDGKVYTLLKNTYKNGIVVDDVPFDICEYNNYIAYCNYFGLFLIDQQSGEKEKINSIKGCESLCVFDNYAYFDHSNDLKSGVITRSSLESHKTKKIKKPFDKDVRINYIYPTKNYIILSDDCKTWYYLDKKSDLHRINFDDSI